MVGFSFWFVVFILCEHFRDTFKFIQTLDSISAKRKMMRMFPLIFQKVLSYGPNMI